MPLIELNDPNRGFLVFDTIVVEATVTLCEKIDYDSKKETGYVRHYQVYTAPKTFSWYCVSIFLCRSEIFVQF